MMTILLLLLLILCAILYFFINDNNNLLKHNKQLKHSAQFFKNKMNKIDLERERLHKHYHEKNVLLDNMQVELFQTYTWLIAPIHILQGRIKLMQSKIAKLQSELHNARKRAKRLAKKTDILV